MPTYFSEHFKVTPKALERYGAFNISLVTDLPLFVDPFLLFNSKKRPYRKLHDEIIEYLKFLRDKADESEIDEGLLRAWYRFPEVKQTWLGFTKTGNAGSGLGARFASSLHGNLHRLFSDFGREKVTRGSHLEKLCLIREGVGRDNISDFTTNLIKRFLCEYTDKFAGQYLSTSQCRQVSVPKVRFNYHTESWEPGIYTLPWYQGDYILLTPKELLTRDDTWINKSDLIDQFQALPGAVPNDQLRAQISNYFEKALARKKGKEPTKRQVAEAARKTLLQFPELIDVFIRFKEDHGDQAVGLSSERVRYSQELYVRQFSDFLKLLANETAFYEIGGSTYDEAHQRVTFLRDVIENKGGQRIFYVNGKPIEREEDVHILYRLTWFGTPSDVSREVNDGRGPADYKISRGAKDKTIVEFKLAKNTQLERNLKRQAEIYQKASDAQKIIKVIFFFSRAELNRLNAILKRVKLLGHKDVVLVDARQDNKPSGSRA